MLHDTFDTGELPLWTLGAGWALTPSEGGLALQVSGSSELVTFVHNTLGDVVIQARFLMDADGVRQSAAGAYTASLDVNGQVALYRGDALLGAALVSPTSPTTAWRTLRISAIEGAVRVAVDGVEVFAALDPAPLSPGTLTFGGNGFEAGALTVDDVEIWISGAPVVTPTLAPTFTPFGIPEPSIPQANALGENIAFAPAFVPVEYTVSTTAELINAISTANNTCSTSPAAILRLENTVFTLIMVNNNFYGQNGLPVIRCDITIEGNGAVIERGSTPRFRIFAVADTGILRINRLTLRNGQVDTTGGSAIFVYDGALYLDNSTITQNSLAVTSGGQGIGAGIYSYRGEVSIEDSTISYNQNISAYAYGGGIGADQSSLSITRSTIMGNTTSGRGGGISTIFATGPTTITWTDIRNNSATEGGGGVYQDSHQGTVSDSCVVGNSDIGMVHARVALDSVLTATNNWWSASEGPDVNNTGSTTGDSISNHVDYQPFAQIERSPAECITPPTPTPTPTATPSPVPLIGRLVSLDVSPDRFDQVYIVDDQGQRVIDVLSPEFRAELSSIDPSVEPDIRAWTEEAFARCYHIPHIDRLQNPPVELPYALSPIPYYGDAVNPPMTNNRLWSFCTIHASLVTLERTLEQWEETPYTYDELVRALIWEEYGGRLTSYIQYSSGDRQWVWKDEAVARHLYEACGIDGCQSGTGLAPLAFELYDFLEYYQPAIQGRLDNSYRRFMEAVRVGNLPNARAILSSSVLAILDPPEVSPAWGLGIRDNRPYGFGRDLCVTSVWLEGRQRSTNADLYSDRQAGCNNEQFASEVANFDGRIDIDFGTYLLPGGLESCGYADYRTRLEDGSRECSSASPDPGPYRTYPNN